MHHKWRRWSRGHKARGQGHKKISRPRTDPLEAIAKDRGNRRKCSPKKKKSSEIFFSDDLHLGKTKKGLHKFFARFLAFFSKISTVQKIVLYSSRGQGNFRGLAASRPRPRTSNCVLEDFTSDKWRSGNRAQPPKAKWGEAR